jgi:hypothetical protein
MAGEGLMTLKSRQEGFYAPTPLKTVTGKSIAADVCAFYVWPEQSTISSIATRVDIGGFEGGL